MRLAALLAFLIQAGPAAPLRFPCSADTMISMAPGEELHSGGARSTLRLKGIEDLTLVDFDLAALRGRRVEEARFHFHPVGETKLKAIGISTVGTPWKEGRGTGDAAQPGEPCYREAARGERPWGRPGGDLHDVTFGRGGSLWFVRDVKAEPEGWMSVEIPPPLLHALLEGNSFGLCLSDERAQTMHNNSFYSREQNAKAPFLVVSKWAPGAAPASGARAYVAAPPKKIADRTAEFVKKPAPAAAVAPATLTDGCRLRILYEGELDPGAAPAGRLWDGASLSLAAARGEHVAFQVALEVPKGQSRAVSFAGDGWSVSRVLAVGNSYDPLIPVEGEVSGTALFHLERHVAKTATPGTQKVALLLKTGQAEISLPVSLRIHSALIPDALSFKVSLNGYGSPGLILGDREGSPEYLALERSFHRLAHEHRATLACVPYSHRGFLQWGMLPSIRRDGAKVEVSSWKEFDGHWGPYFDGSAFQGLPREGAPLDHFYWPLHENWPLPINDFYAYKGTPENHWRDAPPPDQAFSEDYGKAFAAMVREYGLHAAAQGWTRTQFQVFLNNKKDTRFQHRRAEGSWWSLDEPVSLEDHLALRYFALRAREGAKDVKGVPIVFRADLSRPQWRRDTLDGLIDLDVVAGSYRDYPDFVFGRGEQVWVYSTVPGPGGSGEAARAWAMQAFLDGADGVVPWLAVGTPKAWEQPENTALMLPPRKGMERRACATLRLKGLRRGQQDVELLRLLLAAKKASREELRAGVAEALGLRSTFVKTSEVDAGKMEFGKLDPDRFEAFRRALLAALETP